MIYAVCYGVFCSFVTLYFIYFIPKHFVFAFLWVAKNSKSYVQTFCKVSAIKQVPKTNQNFDFFALFTPN